MKYTLFSLFFIIVSTAKSQNSDDDIQELLANFWNTPNSVDSRLKLHPDTGLNISQFLEKYDYPLEYHDVTTEDGFILTMHRIPHGKNEEVEKAMVNKTKKVMFLVHCFACSSMDFVWQGPNISLAFLLADLGYDVWLANGRGNIHSMRHKTLTTNDSAFWDYSFHEKGYYDMPACIDYILSYTKLKQITYIGHSQGTTEGLVLTSIRPEYNKKIKLMVLLSPIVFLENIRSPLLLLLVKYRKAIQLLFDTLKIHGIAYSPTIPLLTSTFCNEKTPFQSICIAIIEVIVGYDIPQIDKNRLTVFLTNTPNGISVREMVHFGQEIESGYFRQYDFGKLGNIFHYGSINPPSYNLRKVTVPIAVYYAQNDYLGSVSGVEKLFSQLPSEPVEKYLIDYEAFNHLDYITAKDVRTLLYERLIRDLQKHVPVL